MFQPCPSSDWVSTYRLPPLDRVWLSNEIHIEVHGAFRQRSAELNEIEGYRTINSRNGSYTQLCLKEGRASITVPSSFATDDAYSIWFSKIPYLDKRDRDAMLEEISQQQDLGATPEERLASLPQAKTWSIFALIAACAAAAAADWGPPALQQPFAAVLVILPIVLAFLIQRSPLLYIVFKRRTNPRAELSFAIFAASFGLLLCARGVHLVSMRSMSLVMILVAIAFCAALFVPIAKVRPHSALSS